MKKLLIAAGGTGGHILPGVALADAWASQNGGKESVLFLGARGGLEERLVPKYGYRLRVIAIGGLKRVGFRRFLRTCLELPLAFAESVNVLLEERPSTVVGIGGFASGPLLLAAALLGWKTAIIEPNSVPGFTNRVLGRLVNHIFVGFDGACRFFPRRKCVNTGVPLRVSIRELPPALMEPFTLFIFGGSQGSVPINSLVTAALPLLKERGILDQIRIIHQTGVQDFERVSRAYADAGVQARVEKFIDDMGSAYLQASLIVCRAGASTLAELASVRRAAILIPLPTAADNHQEQNARAFEGGGAAQVFLQDPDMHSAQATRAEAWVLLLSSLMRSREKIHLMEQKMALLHRPGAAERVLVEMG